MNQLQLPVESDQKQKDFYLQLRAKDADRGQHPLGIIHGADLAAVQQDRKQCLGRLVECGSFSFRRSGNGPYPKIAIPVLLGQLVQ